MSAFETPRRAPRRAKAIQGRKPTAGYIKNALQPLVFYQHEVHNAKLKKNGWNDEELCPFDADKNAGCQWQSIKYVRGNYNVN